MYLCICIRLNVCVPIQVEHSSNHPAVTHYNTHFSQLENQVYLFVGCDNGLYIQQRNKVEFCLYSELQTMKYFPWKRLLQFIVPVPHTLNQRANEKHLRCLTHRVKGDYASTPPHHENVTVLFVSFSSSFFFFSFLQFLLSTPTHSIFQQTCTLLGKKELKPFWVKARMCPLHHDYLCPRMKKDGMSSRQLEAEEVF